VRWVVAQPGPAFSVQDVYVGWVEALRDLGEQVVEFNLDARLTFYGSAKLEIDGELRQALDGKAATELAVNGLYSTLYKARPDVLMVVSAFFLPPELYEVARGHGTRIVVVHTESPYEDRRQAGVAAYADVNLVNDPTNLSLYPAGTRYMPHAYRPSLHHPGPGRDEMVCDLGFVGTGYPSRVEFFERMDLAGLDVLLAGNWPTVTEDSPLYPYLALDPGECLDNTDTADLYRSARMGMNLYRREAEHPDLSTGWAMGPREVEMAASGLFFVRDPRGEGDEVLGMLPAFGSQQEAGDLVRWWLARPDERAEVALKARAAVADRTFGHHAVELLRLLDK
jgi:spore maturation protein CgeB